MTNVNLQILRLNNKTQTPWTLKYMGPIWILIQTNCRKIFLKDKTIEDIWILDFTLSYERLLLNFLSIVEMF